jgi:type VI protein secretion system component VasK
MAADKDPLDIRGREGAIATTTGSFTTPGAQDVATLLMKPVARLKERLGQGGKALFIKIWAEQILPAAREIEKGFPFESGDTEADLKAVTTFLAPKEGKLSVFYDEKLATYFEQSNGQYRPKAGSEFQFTDEFVAYLNNAFALREALFGKSTTPKFEYEFALRPSKDLIEVKIDGQEVKTEGTGSLKGTFPGANSTETGVIIRLASTSETTSASSSNSNVNTASGSPSGGSSGERNIPGTMGIVQVRRCRWA